VPVTLARTAATAGGPPTTARPGRARGRRLLPTTVVTLVVVLGVVVPGTAFAVGLTQADGGHVVVVRNGGPFDDTEIDAQADAARQSGYDSCPTCALIDVMQALPDGLTTYAPGTGFAVSGP